MSTVVTFADKNIIEPGVYSQVKANVNVNPVPFSTGNVLIIDDGKGAGFGGGAGISGEQVNGLDSVYTFTTLGDFRAFVRGGLLWDLAEYLFIPVNGAAGAPQVSIVRAAATNSALINFAFTSGANGGTFAVKTKNEGAAANGVISSAKIRTGYGALMKVGVIDPTKWFIEFYEGTFKGLDNENDPYDGQALLSSQPTVISKSVEFNNINALIAWAQSDPSFNARFYLDATTAPVGSGVLVAGDYTANNTLKAATGGTTTYNSTHFDTVLSKIGEVDYTFMLALNDGDDAQGSVNTKSLYHITQEAEFKKFIVIGGGADDTKFTQTNGSIPTAQYFDSGYAIVCHSGFKINVPWKTSKKLKSALYHAACVCGRLAGVLPQTSLTFKGIRPKEWRHQLTKTQRETALQAGVLHNRFVPFLGYVVNQSINTLQKNTQMINPDGTSAEISIMRIAEQLNKELVLNMRPIFVGQNLNTASPADVKAFIEGYLTFKTASKTQDNLIIKFSDVAVRQIQDYYEVSYNFVPNSPLNKIFVTGFIVDANLSA